MATDGFRGLADAELEVDYGRTSYSKSEAAANCVLKSGLGGCEFIRADWKIWYRVSTLLVRVDSLRRRSRGVFDNDLRAGHGGI